MDAELVTLASSAAAALVGAMTKDGWSHAKIGVIALWRRHRPSQVAAVEEALVSTRTELTTDGGAGVQRVAPVVESRWRGRLETLLEEHPESADDIVALTEQLRSLSGEQDSASVVQHMHADRDVYAAGHDQYITQRPET
jgi:hypothetical protein